MRLLSVKFRMFGVKHQLSKTVTLLTVKIAWKIVFTQC